jgi:hypothetical protein
LTPATAQDRLTDVKPYPFDTLPPSLKRLGKWWLVVVALNCGFALLSSGDLPGKAMEIGLMVLATLGPMTVWTWREALLWSRNPAARGPNRAKQIAVLVLLPVIAYFAVSLVAFLLASLNVA